MGARWAWLWFMTLLVLGTAQNWIIRQNERNGMCTTPYRTPGRCMPTEQCASLLPILRERPISQQTVQFLTQSRCGFNRQVSLVCCPGDNIRYPDPRNPWRYWVAPATPSPTPATRAPNTRPPTRAPNTRPPTRAPITRPTTRVRPISPPPQVPNPTPPAMMMKMVNGEVPDATVENHPNRVLLPTRECGLSANNFGTRIFGGNVTDLDEFPWTALLRYRGRDGREKLLCGAVIISRRYLLTAAHCTNRGDLQGNTLFGARLGEYDTSKEIDCEETTSGEEMCANAPLNLDIEEQIAHPDYRKSSLNQHNDIAVLRLRADIPFNTDFIKPICIPLSRTVLGRNYVGQRLFVTGWGRTEQGWNSPVKLKVRVPVVENQECASTYAGSNRQIVASQMCAGGVRGQDSCNGDSGGPLMSVELGDEGDLQVRYHVTGIVSYGPRSCGTEGRPGVYTRVTQYSAWILDQIRP